MFLFDEGTLCDGGIPITYLYTLENIDYYTRTPNVYSCYSKIYIDNGGGVITIEEAIDNDIITPQDFIDSDWGYNIYAGYNVNIVDTDTVVIYKYNDDGVINFNNGMTLTRTRRLSITQDFSWYNFYQFGNPIDRNIETTPSFFENFDYENTTDSENCLIEIQHEDNTVDTFSLTGYRILHNETGYSMYLDGWNIPKTYKICDNIVS